MSTPVPVKKALPVDPPLALQQQLLFHPETNPTGYVPFEDARTYAFVPKAISLSRVNAWWLADAAWLAYWHDEHAARQVFADNAGLSNCELVASGGTECYVAWSDAFAIVAFRGTQPDDWDDILDDARYLAVPGDAGRVHRGFLHGLDVARAELERVLAKLPGGCALWFTGHSLGAALATLAAYRYRNRAAGAYTFGSPLVGNGAFAGLFGTEFSERSFRYANDHDLVTQVPPPPFAMPHGLYTHVDHLRWINKDGQIGSMAPTLEDFLRDAFGRTNAVLDMIRLHRGDARVDLPPALADHTPLYYALHCWNDFVAHYTVVNAAVV
jgi:triacylglycerol lipase